MVSGFVGGVVCAPAGERLLKTKANRTRQALRRKSFFTRRPQMNELRMTYGCESTSVHRPRLAAQRETAAPGANRWSRVRGNRRSCVLESIRAVSTDAS